MKLISLLLITCLAAWAQDKPVVIGRIMVSGVNITENQVPIGKARAAVAAYRAGGFSDWRLPTRDELILIRDSTIPTERQIRTQTMFMYGLYFGNEITAEGNPTGQAFYWDYGNKIVDALFKENDVANVRAVRTITPGSNEAQKANTLQVRDNEILYDIMNHKPAELYAFEKHVREDFKPGKFYSGWIVLHIDKDGMVTSVTKFHKPGEYVEYLDDIMDKLNEFVKGYKFTPYNPDGQVRPAFITLDL